MGTVVAIETAAGVAIAGDTGQTADGTVTGERVQRVFDLDSAGAGAVGPTGAVQAFGRELEAELRADRIERDGDVGIDRLGRIAADQAERTGVDAVVATRDDAGAGRLREVGPDGRAVPNDRVALGSGAAVALGRLESADLDDADLDRAVAAVREAVAVAIERDAGTAGDVEGWSLASERPSAGTENVDGDGNRENGS